MKKRTQSDRKMKRLFLNIAILIGAAAAGTAVAQEVGGYGYLSLPVSAHAAALGGTLVSAVDPDLALAEQNAALLCPEMSGQLAVGYMNYVADINLAYAAYGGRFLELGGWTASARLLSYGDFDGYDAEGHPTGTFSAKDMAFSAGVGYPLSEHWRIGGFARALYSKYESYSAFALAVDVGVNYYNEVSGRSLSAVVTGLGGQLKRMEDRSQPVRPDLVVGWSKEIEHLPFCLTLTAYRLLDWDDEYVGGDGAVHRYSGGDRLLTHLNFGAEWVATDDVWIGLGYNYRRQREFSGGGGFLRGLSVGGGLRWRNLLAEVAYGRYNAVDGSLSLGISYRFR